MLRMTRPGPSLMLRAFVAQNGPLDRFDRLAGRALRSTGPAHMLRM